MTSIPGAPDSRAIIALALAEDLGVPVDVFLADASSPIGAAPLVDVLGRDVTSSAVIPADAVFEGRIVAREQAVVCGLPVAGRVWSTLARAAGADPEALEVFPLVAEGARVDAGTAVAEVAGPARIVLAGERTALDFVMVLSGIATEAARWQTAAGPDVAVCDTRKTWPGLRALSKYAVRVGGATNHRAGLWDMVLVKDNHVRAAGGVESAVAVARSLHPELAVEVEAESIRAAVAGATAGADIVLLDNMGDAALRDAVAAVAEVVRTTGRACLTEASGGITYARLESLRDTGVDRISSSAITFAPPIDFGFDEVTQPLD